MIPIDKNIPIPGKSGGMPTKYPFNEMKIGDSFFIPLIDIAQNKRNSIQSSMSTCSRQWAKANNKPHKFITRQIDKGVRIWRVK